MQNVVNALKTTLCRPAVTKCYGSDGIVESYMSRIGNIKEPTKHVNIQLCFKGYIHKINIAVANKFPRNILLAKANGNRK